MAAAPDFLPLWIGILHRVCRISSICDVAPQRAAGRLKDHPAALFCFYRPDKPERFPFAVGAKGMKDRFTVMAPDPIQPHSLRGLYIRRAKTDAGDSHIITDLARFGRRKAGNAPQNIRLIEKQRDRQMAQGHKDFAQNYKQTYF